MNKDDQEMMESRARKWGDLEKADALIREAFALGTAALWAYLAKKYRKG